jgi:hypothetical protein
MVDAVECLLAETGAGLVFISMRLEDVWLCDRAVFMKDGSIAYAGGKEALPGWLLDQGLPLTGLSLVLGRMEKVAPGLARSVALGPMLSADRIAGALAGICRKPKGGAGCP